METTASDGVRESWWWQPSTGSSAWELPLGASTLCGWRYTTPSGEKGVPPQWVHTASGAVTFVPPPLKLRRAERLIRQAQRMRCTAEEGGAIGGEEVAAAAAAAASAAATEKATEARAAAKLMGKGADTAPKPKAAVAQPTFSPWWEHNDSVWGEQMYYEQGEQGGLARGHHKDEVAALVDRARAHKDVLAAVVEFGGFKARAPHSPPH